MELCLEAFDGRVRAAIPQGPVPDSWEGLFDRLGGPAALREDMREGLTRQLSLARRASAMGHIPSQYLHAMYFGMNARELDLEGLLEPEEAHELLERLAEATFPPAEKWRAMRTYDEGFFPPGRFEPGFDDAAAARNRWEFFTWMTRAGLHGYRKAWEDLANAYAYQGESFGDTADDRVRGYAWTHMRSIPTNDVQRRSRNPHWSGKKRKAWARLEGADEQRRARALAARYERELLPRVIPDASNARICRLEPQFTSQDVTARRIAEPVGPPWDPPPPEPLVLPSVPAGIEVLTHRIEVAADVGHSSASDRLLVAEIPKDKAGVLERALCVIREAPILQEKGMLGGNVNLERSNGKRHQLCAFSALQPVVVDRPLGERAFALEGGEEITFACGSFVTRWQRGDSLGCTVDLYLWIRPEDS